METRFTELEIRYSHLERQVADLSDVVFGQQKIIESLQLELDPLGPESEARRKVAMVVLEAPDIQVPLCSNPLGSFIKEKTPHHDLFLQQMLFSTMAFMIEQPERASDVQAGFLAGILGALKAYAKVCELEPASRSPFLDHMLDLQKSGELEAFYRKACAPAP
jgi:uncharacterized coiled-coil protein SlyX